MASKKKINLADFDLLTTLGTGKACKKLDLLRFFRQSASVQKQEDWRVLRDEDPKEGRHYQAQAGGPRHFREHHLG
jgi:hypothetical protein